MLTGPGAMNFNAQAGAPGAPGAPGGAPANSFAPGGGMPSYQGYSM